MELGIGVNFSNKKPSTCLLEFSKEITVPKLMEKFRSELNYYLYLLEHEGFRTIKEEYYQNWMHKNFMLNIFGPRGTRRKAQIVGLSDKGNLEVKYLDTKEIMEFNYNEYGIDIEKGCIKHRFAPKINIA